MQTKMMFTVTSKCHCMRHKFIRLAVHVYESKQITDRIVATSLTKSHSQSTHVLLEIPPGVSATHRDHIITVISNNITTGTIEMHIILYMYGQQHTVYMYLHDYCIVCTSVHSVYACHTHKCYRHKCIV